MSERRAKQQWSAPANGLAAGAQSETVPSCGDIAPRLRVFDLAPYYDGSVLSETATPKILSRKSEAPRLFIFPVEQIDEASLYLVATRVCFVNLDKGYGMAEPLGVR